MQSQNPISNSPAENVIANAISTIANPSPEQIVADIQQALNLFLEFKQSLNGLHPSVMQVIKFLL